jgi:hypothetical protein
VTAKRDEPVYVQREPEPLFARVWFDFIGDPRIRSKPAITLYVALAKTADFVGQPVTQLFRNGEEEADLSEAAKHSTAYPCFPVKSYRRRLCRDARIGSFRTFYKALDELIAAGWLRRDSTESMVTRLGLDPLVYRGNWPPMLTLLRPKLVTHPRSGR